MKAKRQAMQTLRPKQRGCKAGTGRGPGVGRGMAACQALPGPGDWTKHRLESCPSPTRLGPPGMHLDVLAPPPALSRPHHHGRPLHPGLQGQEGRQLGSGALAMKAGWQWGL